MAHCWVPGRLHAEPNRELRSLLLPQFEVVIRRFLPALQRTLPHLTAGEVAWRTLFTIGALSHVMCWDESVPGVHAEAATQPGEIVDALVQFAAAGMAAPAGSRTTGVRQ